eukprot:Sro269_g104140.2  (140) ;mRNA; r:78300-78719
MYHRILALMSASDMVGSTIFVLSSWPIPQETGIYLASGTVDSCEVVGFVNQIVAILTPAYNVSLVLYYYLTIAQGLRPGEMCKYQYYLYFVPLVYALAMAIPGLPLDLYNAANFVCWIAPYPPGCQGNEFERGHNADTY